MPDDLEERAQAIEDSGVQRLGRWLLQEMKAAGLRTISGQLLLPAALPSFVDHQQRRAFPDVELRRANQCERHLRTC